METLRFLLTAGGAGVAGSLLFEGLRMLVPAPAEGQPLPGGVRGLFLWLIWSPRGARITAMALSAIVVLFAASVLALITGDPWHELFLNAIDELLAASAISQLTHLPQLSAATRRTPSPQE